MSIRIAGLTLSLLLAAPTLAAAGQIMTGPVLGTTSQLVICLGVHFAAGTRTLTIEVLDVNGDVEEESTCPNQVPGDPCHATAISTSTTLLEPFTCRITGQGVIASKLRGTLTNPTTGATSDAR
jgi:hypothetical protein